MADLISTEQRAQAPGIRRWLALVVISVAQLIGALDATIMNIALPSAQHALNASDADRQWVITAYTLAFAGLMLLGGKLADYLGRKRAFLIGLAGFAVASAFGGAATAFWMLIVGRAAQGAFAAMLIPTALSLLASTFTQPKERAKAFAIYGAIASGGGAVGLLAGGALTQYTSWRWCLYINVIIAVLAGLAGSAVLPDVKPGGRHRFDVLGVVLVTGGLVSFVYACSEAATKGWGSTEVVTLIVVALVLLVLFVRWEARAAEPLLPLRILWNRNRIGSCLSAALSAVGMFGMFLLLTYYFQVVLEYSPIHAGLAFLPMTVAVAVSAFWIATPLMPRVPPRLVIVPGLLVAAAGLLLLTTLTAASGYVSHVLPAEILLGGGLGCVTSPAFSLATLGVARHETGVASGMASTAQQVGGSLGVAVINTIAAGATATALASHVSRSDALVHGYTTATAWAAGILVAAAILATVLITAPRPERHHP